MKMNLSQIANGVRVLVTLVDESPLKVKLMEMGVIEGKELKVLYRAPLGDPIAVNVSGYVLSMRKDEASLVHVETLKA